MIARVRSWWKHLGYCWNGGRDGFRTFGIRPWRGAPFLWFVIDVSSTARQSDGHNATCEECAAAQEPSADSGNASKEER